jgi:hypothetical protein
VRDLLKRTGGIRPVPRRRWELRLSLAEREEISRGLAAGDSQMTARARTDERRLAVLADVDGQGLQCWANKDPCTRAAPAHGS